LLKNYLILGLVVVLCFVSFSFFLLGFLRKEGLDMEEVVQMSIVPKCTMNDKKNVFGRKIIFDAPLTKKDMKKYMKTLTKPEIKRWSTIIRWSRKSLMPRKVFGMYTYEITKQDGSKISLVGGNGWIKRRNGEIYTFDGEEFLSIFRD